MILEHPYSMIWYPYSAVCLTDLEEIGRVESTK